MIARLLLVLTFLLACGSISSRNTGKQFTNPNGSQYSVDVPKSKLLSADSAVSRKKDVDEDVKNQLSTHMGWEQLLSPAPLTIGLLGDLMIMSTKARDFAINKQVPPNGAIRYVKYPKSFRATLVQIGNDGQRAFMVAHNNMDKIRLLTAGVPGYMKQATEILVTGDAELVADYLPAPMFRIREAAQLSVSLSKQVVWQFEYVMNLTSEVLEMCINEKSLQEANLYDAIREQKRVNLTLPSFQQMVDQLNSSIARDAAVMDRAEQDMRKALRDMPGGWEMIGMNFLQNVGDVLLSTLTTAAIMTTSPHGASIVAAGLGAKMVGGIVEQADKDTLSGEPLSVSNADAQQSGESSQSALGIDDNPCIVDYRIAIMTMDAFAEELYESTKQLASIDSVKGRYDAASDIGKLQIIASKVDICPPVANIVEQGLLFVNELAKLASQTKPVNVTDEEFKENRQVEFEHVRKNIGARFRTMAFNMKKLLMRNQQAIPNNTPLITNARQQINTKGSASQQALASCLSRANMAQATLLSTRKAMEETREKMIENNKEVIRLLTEQQSLKLDEVRYEEIIKALEKGLEKLAVLKEHWTKLVMFFQKIANIVENVAAKSIEDFANHIDTTSSKLRHIHKQLVIDQLYAKALKATQASSFVNNMAETYVSVSDKFIMPRVSSLSKFITIDPKIAEAERLKLLADCSKDSEAIVEMIVAEKQMAIRRIEQRAAKIREEYAFLHQIKERQIKELRRMAEFEIDQQESGKQLTMKERQNRVDTMVNLKIENDVFLGGYHILNDEGHRTFETIDKEEY